MLLDRHVLDGITRGEITVAFRRWRRPTVRSGGTLLTGAGQLDITSVSQIEVESITDADAARAGYASRELLLEELNRRSEGAVYRIELGALRPDPRIALRETQLDAQQAADIAKRLARMDAASPDGPWTRRTLEVIRDHPEVRAADLCRLVGQERDRFKPNVRKLKELGLTISLEVGYRLSPRGEAWLRGASSAG